MQAKGLVKFFGLALVLVCLYQLSFTFVANRVVKKAEQFAQDQTATQNISDANLLKEELRKNKRRYLDSVENQSVYPLLGYDYGYVKERQLNLGLDLQGGMSVVLQVTLEDMIRAMAFDRNDETLNNAISRAKELQKENDVDFITLFAQAVKEVNPNASLAALFSTPENDKITPGMNDDAVLEIIQEEAKGAVNRTFEILRTRIDKFGVTQPNINLNELNGRITVELPGVDDPERVRKLLQATAQLEFWECYENSAEIFDMLNKANDAVKTKLGIVDNAAGDSEKKGDDAADALLADNDSTDVDVEEEEDLLSAESDSINFEANNPFLSVFRWSNSPGALVGFVDGKDTARLNEYLRMPEVQSHFPADLKFLTDYQAFQNNDDEDANNNLFPIYAVRSTRPNEMTPALGGDVITDASQNIGANQDIVVSMQMNKEGAKRWRDITRDNIGKSVAIVLDDVVYSAPTVQAEIAGGSSQITGNFDMVEAQDLANILKAGKLPAPARIVEEALVGPSLGQKSITNGMISLIAGILIVLLFMILYYSNSGFVANLALILNLFFVFGVLAALGATLTLPGMAGIVLTVGMAVDANVIIFERIREELAKGSGVRKAIADGYTKSYSAIIDANLTTLITAIILYYFGLGPVLGFATVLMIGIFSSLFTAILITRLVFDWWMGRDGKPKFDTGFSANRFKNLNIDFISKRRLGYIIGGVVIGIGLISMIARGFELGVDFKGGRTYVVEFPQNVNTTDVRNALAGPLEAPPLVRTYGGSNQVKITSSYKIADQAADVDNEVVGKVYEGLKPMLGGASYEDFGKNHLQSSQKVGPTIADDIKRGAFKATFFALLGIFLYILLRFRRWQFGLAAVLTIIHDTLILLTIFSLFPGILPFSLEIDQTFIAALLTVIGYSINDTVVVFDRIREYLQLNPKRDEKEVINEAINSTLSRTIITSITTLFVVLILFIFGGEVIRGFSFALLIGIIVGTYSSIFIATPIVVDLSEQYAKRVKTGKDTGKKKRGRSKRTKAVK